MPYDTTFYSISHKLLVGPDMLCLKGETIIGLAVDVEAMILFLGKRIGSIFDHQLYYAVFHR